MEKIGLKQNKKLFIGITGNIGSGKSEVSSYLTKKGYKVIDADAIVKDIYNNAEFKEKIINSFGETIIKKENNDIVVIDKKVLSNMVFTDKSKLDILEKIITPFFTKYFNKEKENISEEIVFFDIPLLFEKGYNNQMDISALVYCRDDIRYNRVLLRDKKTEEEVLAVDKNQMPQDEKILLADYVIYNNDTKDELIKNIEEFLIKIKI